MNFGAGSARTLVDRVIAGEYAIALNIFAHHPLISRAKGAPVNAQLMDPVASTAATMSVDSGDVSSPAISGALRLNQNPNTPSGAPGVGNRRRSTPLRKPGTPGASSGIDRPSADDGGGSTRSAATVVVGIAVRPTMSSTRMRSTVARTSSTSPARSSTSSVWIFLPSRVMRVSTSRRSPIGAGRTMSTVRRVSCIGVSDGTRSAQRASSACTGPPCCWFGCQAPWVHNVATKPSPSGS